MKYAKTIKEESKIEVDNLFTPQNNGHLAGRTFCQ
jgi:hypothetical protein